MKLTEIPTGKKKVAVISPVAHSGKTTVATLLAQIMGSYNELQCVLTYAGDHEEEYEYALGFEDDNSVAHSLTQIVQLLKHNRLSAEHLTDYMEVISNNTWLLKASAPDVSEHDAQELFKYMLGEIDMNVTFIDCVKPLEDKLTQYVLSQADITLIVVDSSTQSILKMEKWFNEDKYDELLPPDDKIIYVVNNYDPTVANITSVAKRLGVKARDLIVLNHSPYIGKLTAEQRLQEILPPILENDGGVYDIASQLKEAGDMIAGILGFGTRKG